MAHSMLGRDILDRNMVIHTTPPKKYSEQDWSQNNQLKSKMSRDQQRLADRVLCESDRVIDETRLTTEQWKKETDHRLEERLIDIDFRVEELKKQKKTALLEEENLKVYRSRINYAIDALQEGCLIICEKCIVTRDNRRGIDMVADQVDRELRKEREIILGSQAIQRKLLGQTTEQIRRLRATIYLLDRDLSNKESSFQIDKQNLLLRENQMDMKLYQGKLPLDPFNSTDAEWIRDTNRNIEETAKELNSSKPLRSYVDIMLKQVVEDLENQVSRTNEAFLNRIGEMRYTKNKLEAIHCATANQVNEITRNITKLEKELAEKEGFVALTQMRLGNRAQRIGLELCKDSAQNTLVRELFALRDTCGKLQKMIEQSKATLRYLLNTQMLQEEEINLKTNSLKIDEVDCMTIRETLRFQSF